MKKWLFTSLILSCLAGCPASRSSSPTLAMVDGEKITLSDFQKAMEVEQWKFGSELGLEADKLKQLKTRVVENLIKDRLLLAEAKKRDIAVSEEEVEESVARLKSYYSRESDFEKMLSLKGLTVKDFVEQRKTEHILRKLAEQVGLEQTQITPEELQKYYENHLSEFKHPEHVHCRQIVTDSGEKAEVLQKMLVDGTPFADVAQKYSLSPDRKSGGDLGWFGKGEMPEEFEHICFKLKPGELSRVIRTPYGHHLFEVLERRGAGQFPLDEVRENIRKKLAETKGRDVFQKWYEALRAQAKIEVREEMLDGKN